MINTNEEAPEVVRKKYTGALSGRGGYAEPLIVQFEQEGAATMIGRKNCRPFDRLLKKTESEMEQWLRENFSYENTPKSIFSARLSTVVFAMSNKLKMYFSKIVQKCLENALGYPVLFGFADQLILYGPVRVWANLGKSPESREDVIKWEKKLDFAKNDTNLSVSKVQEWVESANIFGLPKELTMDEVRQEINDWVGQDKPIRFPFDRELFEKEIENCPMLAGGPTQSFIDWVEEGNWARNGSANLGHIKFTMQDKSIRVKAAKNMVMYIRDYKDLAGYIMEEAKNREFEIGAIQKIEPKLKPRVAVSDNFINYMLTNYLFGDYSDRNIDDGNVLKESVKKTMKRYENRLKLLDNTYCVSWDWSGFDRWPELKDVVRTVIPLIRSNLTGIGDEQLLAWKNMRGKFVIVTKQGEEVYRKKVQGGITSGDFLTNYMDTIYNRAAVLTAAKLGKVNLLSYDLKGDDVMAIFPTYDDAIIWVEEMQRANIEAKVDIFGVAQGRGEFLQIGRVSCRERV